MSDNDPPRQRLDLRFNPLAFDNDIWVIYAPGFKAELALEAVELEDRETVRRIAGAPSRFVYHVDVGVQQVGRVQEFLRRAREQFRRRRSA